MHVEKASRPQALDMSIAETHVPSAGMTPFHSLNRTVIRGQSGYYRLYDGWNEISERPVAGIPELVAETGPSLQGETPFTTAD